MKSPRFHFLVVAAVLLTAITLHTPALAQPRGGPPGPRVVSPEVADGKISFRILAPKAEVVRLSAGDMPGLGQGKDMTKNAEGVWEVTVDVPPGYYRYHFSVDGVTVADPRNPATSESVGSAWSLVGMPGNDQFDAIYHETEGGHTWINWRDYLREFAPRLFQ